MAHPRRTYNLEMERFEIGDATLLTHERTPVFACCIWRTRVFGTPCAMLAAVVVKCRGAFQNVLGTFTYVLNHVTRGRAPRGRPDLAGCLPRCARTGVRVKLCGKLVPTLVEPRTFEQCVLKEVHSNQTSGHGAGI